MIGRLPGKSLFGFTLLLSFFPSCYFYLQVWMVFSIESMTSPDILYKPYGFLLSMHVITSFSFVSFCSHRGCVDQCIVTTSALPVNLNDLFCTPGNSPLYFIFIITIIIVVVVVVAAAAAAALAVVFVVNIYFYTFYIFIFCIWSVAYIYPDNLCIIFYYYIHPHISKVFFLYKGYSDLKSQRNWRHVWRTIIHFISIERKTYGESLTWSHFVSVNRAWDNSGFVLFMCNYKYNNKINIIS